MSNTLPVNLGKRFGDVSLLPENLKNQLNAFKVDELESNILAVLKDDLDGIGNIDEILVSLYKKTNKVEERKSVSSRLYKLTTRKRLEKVAGKKGVYRFV
ncbi:hypothetical protein FBY51_1862 [Zymomonas mobilis]|uniref:hypothetical protein n=1 Tax=Zymomonas mobilis TaxID=542 RepID=UPI00026D82C8|nr:hypothetical protein [Zymomonas mobilis]AFN57613.1 hypothetical protein ZZ6_1762 [Zymomonas mobilis subsp. mobilis ATCC 29191]TQK75368.1 hypothetical protein FBY53_1797 [Zymomonas mobilis]TQL14603.1 hypothetical protein FBY51_1862 [Zymomonas mobilis]GEB88350.1 hypothetical protein ZMO01_16900 [Zymomonas mobilis subsp. mobilis]